MTSTKIAPLIRTLKAYRPYGMGETSFLVFHPDREHPYEKSEPLPEKTTSTDSILKVDSRHMITKSPNLEQLQALTFTPARYWKEYKGRDKRHKYIESFNDNVDRKGFTS